MTKTTVALTVEQELNEWAASQKINRSQLFENALRKVKAQREMAAGLVYTVKDATARVARAIELIQEAHGKEDTLEGRISASFVAKRQAAILSELWPDTSFSWADLFKTARVQAGLPSIPVEQ